MYCTVFVVVNFKLLQTLAVFYGDSVFRSRSCRIRFHQCYLAKAVPAPQYPRRHIFKKLEFLALGCCPKADTTRPDHILNIEERTLGQ
jgi:hypothetical protein